MRVALVHDWLTGMRGGEKVLEVLAELFPRADLFTLVHVRGSAGPALEARRIRTSWLQRLPSVERRYRWALPLFPAAIERFDLRGYDLVLSSSHCVAKGARPASGALAVWEMNGTAALGVGMLPTVDPSWAIADGADFNGDGKADVLWRHTSGAAHLWLLYAWMMIGEGSLGTIDPSWVIQNR